MPLQQAKKFYETQIKLPEQPDRGFRPIEYVGGSKHIPDVNEFLGRLHYSSGPDGISPAMKGRNQEISTSHIIKRGGKNKIETFNPATKQDISHSGTTPTMPIMDGNVNVFGKVGNKKQGSGLKPVILPVIKPGNDNFGVMSYSKSNYEKKKDSTGVAVATAIGGKTAGTIVGVAQKAKDEIKEGIKNVTKSERVADLAYNPYKFLYKSIFGKY